MLATMPLGDTEMLDRVRERCDDVEARAAGATKLVEARLEPRN
jgi:phage shock protein A